MKKISVRIFLLMLILVGIGFIMIFSSSFLSAQDRFNDQYFFLKRQVMHFFIGLMLQLFCIKYDYIKYKKHAGLLMAFSIALLIVVMAPGLGQSAGGARRWLGIGNLRFQPSEFVKIVLLIYVANFLDNNVNKMKSFLSGLLPVIVVVGVTAGLIFLQRDFGTPVLLGAVSVMLLFIGGARVLHLALIFLLALPALYMAVWKTPYRRQRILSFLDPWQDPGNTGYQIIQSLIALGSGGIFGVGLGQGRQKLAYLPESHTDFIFSIIGEEMGLVGSLSVVFIFLCLFWYGLKVAWNAKDMFGHYLATGIVLMLSIQSMIHIGVVTGALPTKGITLPFISFGGSSLVINMIAVGILINISKHQKEIRVKRRRRLKLF